jgi:glycosyltransferase involved in cell wall biosynthesis
VNIHDLQGLGYNSVKAIAQRDVPVVYTLHDLGLACVKMSMFVNGRECQRYCQVCRITAEVKFNYLKRIKKLAFISPSSANLEKLKSLLPISDFPSYRVLNPNEYPVPRVQRKPGKRLRLLYVGRLHQSKGLDVVLQALLRLDRRDDFTLRVLGSGPDEVALRETYGGHSWIRFEGHVSLQDVADRMANSDLLLVPSLWLENSPGVVIQALGLGLPVMGSDKGGIPELVRPNENGLLVEAGNVDAWGEAISAIIADPARLEPLRLNAESGASQFAKPTIAQQALTIFEDLVRR